MTTELIFEGNKIPKDKHGYLMDFKKWTEAMAHLLSEHDGIELTDAHWEIIMFVREFYLTYNTSPAIRALTKALKTKFGEDKASSRYLFRLFPDGPAKQATKYAGLPKPARCL